MKKTSKNTAAADALECVNHTRAAIRLALRGSDGSEDDVETIGVLYATHQKWVDAMALALKEKK